MLPSSIRRRYLLRKLNDGRARAAAEASLEGLSEAEVRARCEQAWRTHETDLFLERADWLHRRGLLSRKEGLWLSQRLIELGRHAEALPILTERQYARPKTADHWARVAVALAATGELRAAAQALHRAMQIDGGLITSPPEFAAALQRVKDRAEAIDSWSEAAALVEAWVILGLPQHAGATLAGAFGRALPRSEDEIVEALNLGQDILSWSDPQAAVGFIDQMRPAFGRLGLAADVDPLAEPLPAEVAASGVHPGVQVCLALALTRQQRREEAVALLQPFASHLKDAEIPGAERARMELARCVGKLVLDEVRPEFGPSARRKVVDMFPFNDERLLLEVKLEEMYDWVDHFVIVEADFTFRGQPKPLHFESSRADFARFADKIVHVVVRGAPEWATTPWAREFYQRDSGLRALKHLCGEDDLVLITDADEIVDRRTIERLHTPFVSLGMPTYAYFFNLERVSDVQSSWGAALKARHLQKIGASYARFALPGLGKSYRLADAGWHFSSVRDVAGLVSKFSSYSNTQYADVRSSDLERLVGQIRADGGLAGYRRRDLDQSFPRYIREHPERLADLIL